MKILFWQCDKTNRDACKWVFRQAKEMGYDVEMAGYRDDPSEFLAKLEDWKPDWVFSYAVRPNLNPIYHIIKAKGIKLAISYHDAVDPKRVDMFHRMSGYFDIAIFSAKESMKQVGNCAKQSHFIPQYFAHNFNELKWKRLDQSKLIYDICFLTFAPCPLRFEYIYKLSQKYKVFYAENKIGADMTEVYAQSKIAVGLPRKGFTDIGGEFVTSNRLFNAMGSGAFYLSHKIVGIEKLFKTGEHFDMLLYNDYEHWEDTIDLWLKNDLTRERIAFAGQQEILKNHTLKTRVPQYMRLLENFKE